MIRKRPISALAVATLLTGTFGQILDGSNTQAQEGSKNVIPYLDEQPARARHGMVVSVHHLAADAGVEIMRAGGNAVDAAVATEFERDWISLHCNTRLGSGADIRRKEIWQARLGQSDGARNSAGEGWFCAH